MNSVKADARNAVGYAWNDSAPSQRHRRGICLMSSKPQGSNLPDVLGDYYDDHKVGPAHDLDVRGSIFKLDSYTARRNEP